MFSTYISRRCRNVLHSDIEKDEAPVKSLWKLLNLTKEVGENCWNKFTNGMRPVFVHNFSFVRRDCSYFFFF